MTPEELVLTIIDMHQRHAPMATILTVAARALQSYGDARAAQERERCAALAEEGMFQIGCTADEAVGVVRRTRDAIAAAIRALD